MKEQFDRKSVAQSFQTGDNVLVLLPIVGSSLQARFSGPYVMERKLSDRKKKVVCVTLTC